MLVRWLVLAALLLPPSAAFAHPFPYSYVDLRIQPSGLEATVVVHVFDVAHDLGVEPMEQLLDVDVLRARSPAIAAMLTSRFVVAADGTALVGQWSPAELIADRQSLRFRVSYPQSATPGMVSVKVDAFPYDPEHRTFLNVYEGDTVAAQEILEGSRREVEHFTGSRQGVRAIVGRFLPSGVHHILIGPDHVLFLVGLLLTGGSFRRLLLIVTAFTLAHSVTLSLAALEILTPPAWLVEPAIALSIVYVGIDNLIRGHGRDVRAWIAFAFGFVHGFGFANVLRDMDLPARALGWSLFSFNAGVEVGQVVIVAVVASALYALRARSVTLASYVTAAGSVVVIAAGAYWFGQRVFW